MENTWDVLIREGGIALAGLGAGMYLYVFYEYLREFRKIHDGLKTLQFRAIALVCFNNFMYGIVFALRRITLDKAGLPVTGLEIFGDLVVISAIIGAMALCRALKEARTQGEI